MVPQQGRPRASAAIATGPVVVDKSDSNDLTPYVSQGIR
jgi:hypothetical protein